MDIDPVGSYFRKRIEGDEWIKWNWSSWDIFNFVRGITAPGPFARTIYNGNILLIKEVSAVPSLENYNGEPGEILEKSKTSIFVATGDTVVEIHNSDVLFRKSLDIIELEFNIGEKFYSNWVI
jgi:methionyl-tRNA formyltransferase